MFRKMRSVSGRIQGALECYMFLCGSKHVTDFGVFVLRNRNMLGYSWLVCLWHRNNIQGENFAVFVGYSKTKKFRSFLVRFCVSPKCSFSCPKHHHQHNFSITTL